MASNKKFNSILGLLNNEIKSSWGENPVFWKGRCIDEAKYIHGKLNIDYLISSTPTPTDGWLSIIKGHISTVPNSMLGPDGMTNLSAIASSFHDGTSLVLNQLTRRVIEIGLMCRALESEFFRMGLPLQRSIGANLYITPNKSKGLNIHFDDHHVLVIQLSGTKSWRIYKEFISCPNKPQGQALNESCLGSPVIDVTIAPGDVLYIPPGFPHKAWTDEGQSIHITMGIYPSNWIDLACMVLSEEEKARKSLPFGILHNLDEIPPKDILDDIFSNIFNKPALHRGLNEISDRYIDSLYTLPSNHLNGQRSNIDITSEATFEVSKGVLPKIDVVNEWVHVKSPGVSFRCNKIVSQSIHYIFDNNSFTISELPKTQNKKHTLDLINALLEQGLITTKVDEC